MQPLPGLGSRWLKRARTFGSRGLSGVPYSFSPFPKRAQVPGAGPLKHAHAALDTAVLTAYGFSAKKDLLANSSH